MPRSSSTSNKSAFSSQQRSSYSSPKTPVSLPANTSSHTPLIQHHSDKIEKPGFFSNVWQGFGLGTGQAIAHNIFRSDPKIVHIHENLSQSNSSSETRYDTQLSKEYVQCMKDNDDDKELCKQFLK